MRRALRTRARKKVKVRLAAKKNVIHIKAERPNYHQCGSCGAKLNRKRLLPIQIKKIPKVRRRPERPLPELCSRCMRLKMKDKVR